MKKNIFLAVWFCLLAVTQTACAASTLWQDNAVGSYTFTKWAGGKIDVEYIVPKDSDADTKILLVVPGARRNADDYRDQWLSLAQKNQFIVLAIGCSLQVCEDEYQYNLGGITTPLGATRPESVQFYNVPEKVFHDFVSRFGSTQETFALYGHSAGGGFVHTFMLAKPHAPVSHAVSANAAFFTYPDPSQSYPFGLENSPYSDRDVDTWLQKPMTIILADQDMGPRTKTISNSPAANRQGRNVFARGLAFYAKAMNVAVDKDIKPAWQIEVVRGVGHNSTKIVPFAFKYLFPEFANGHRGNKQ
jgi:poly(3-hydroxybutyrate) depolymerase